MIYFAQAMTTNLIKIGYTTRPVSERLALLQTGSAELLVVIGWMPGGRDVERSLHKGFAAAHARGEWFRPTLALLQFVHARALNWSPEFAALAELEPRLIGLYLKAKAHHQNPSPFFCANAAWYGYGGFFGLKPQLLALVGFEARKESLRTTEAYDVAYDTIYDALPGCRECGCS